MQKLTRAHGRLTRLGMIIYDITHFYIFSRGLQNFTLNVVITYLLLLVRV